MKKRATKLCDHVIGFEWKGDMGDCYRSLSLADGRIVERKTGEQYRVTAKGGEMFTCDRPMCDDCAITDGWTHYKGSDEHPELSGFESHDLCPQCVSRPKDNINPCTKEEAAAIRDRMWKESAGMLRLVQPTPEPGPGVN